MELLRLKTRLNLARKGYGLLKKKLDVLVSHLFELMKKFKDRQSKIGGVVGESKEIAKIVSREFTHAELEAISNYNSLDYTLVIVYRNIMGVKIPKISMTEREREVYYPFLRSVSLGALAKINRELLDVLIDLTEIVAGLKYILREIRKTKRRVNSLQYVIIPKIERDIEMIRQKLEEMERENFVKLRSLKRDEV